MRGLHCAEEAQLIEKRLRQEPGVGALTFDYLTERMTVEHDASAITSSRIEAAVRETGLGILPWGAAVPPESFWMRWGSRLLATVSGLAVLATTIHEALEADNFWLGLLAHAEHHEHGPEPAVLALYATAILAGAIVVAPRAWRAIRHRHLDMNVLVMVAMTAATVLGEYGEAATLAFLFSLANVIENWSRQRAARLLEAHPVPHHHHHHASTAAYPGSSTEQFMDRFARWYTPAIHVIAVLVAILLPAARQSAGGAMNAALMVLLTACPCALVLSTPVTFASALASASRRGVYARRSAVLEQISNGDAIDPLLDSGELSLSPDTPAQREFAVRHARRAIFTLRTNIAIAIGAKVLFLAMVFLDQAALWMAVASDLGATVLVTLLSLRMLAVSSAPQAGVALARQAEQEP